MPPIAGSLFRRPSMQRASLAETVALGGGVEIPADSGIYFPTDSAHYDAMGLPDPLYRWEGDDASGGAVDAVSAKNCTTWGSPLYQQAMADFTSRVGIGPRSGSGFYTPTGVPDIHNAGTSVAVYGVIDVTGMSSGTARTIMLINSKVEIRFKYLNHEAFLYFNGSEFGTGASYSSESLGVLLVWDKNAGTVKLHTPDAEVAGTYSATVAPNNNFNFSAGGSNWNMGKCDVWTGTDAEGMDKNTLAAYGWTISY